MQSPNKALIKFETKNILREIKTKKTFLLIKFVPLFYSLAHKYFA